ncbi:MAG: hypothetical protein WDO71_28460 [Bacteroidota bacterium]
MKTLLFPVIGLITHLTALSQDSCAQKQFSALKRIIQKSVPNNEGSYSNKLSEFFIIEIEVNEKDSITGIDYFRKGTSYHTAVMDSVIKKLKAIWNTPKCGIDRFIVPVFIYFQEGGDKLYNSPIDMHVNKKIYNQPGKATYIFDVISVLVWGG